MDAKCFVYNANNYQKDAMRTCSIPMEGDALQDIFPNDKTRGMFVHSIAEINSEAGEIAGILQKIYQGHGFDKMHMMKEIGDVLWGIAELCEALDISIIDVMFMNIEKLKARYPEGFTAEKSLHRKAGDI